MCWPNQHILRLILGLTSALSCARHLACIFASGVYPTVAGILVALLIPVRTHTDAETFFSSARRRLMAAPGLIPGSPRSDSILAP